MGNLTQKGKCVPWKGQWHWQTTKVCSYIHICIYRHLYRSLLSQSSGIQAHSTGFRFHSTGIWWIPVESGGIWRNGCIPAGICGASKNTALKQVLKGWVVSLKINIEQEQGTYPWHYQPWLFVKLTREVIRGMGGSAATGVRVTLAACWSYWILNVTLAAMRVLLISWGE